MDVQDILNFVETDKNLESEEKEFTVTFSKRDDKAFIHTSISSQIKRAITHSDIVVDEITTYNKDSDTYNRTTLDSFDGEGIIVSMKGKVPIESLKIQSNPRKNRSYAQIISPQTEVNFDA